MKTLDKFDIAILNELQLDARLTNTDLASRVGLSAAPCWRRVRALEEAGFITGYRAEINRHKIGLGVLAFVRLDAAQNTLNTFSQFARDVLINLPNVKDLHTSFSLGEVKTSSALPLGHLTHAIP
jgi:Lrp/AsnC family leucine-responsive transcriptional regulator